MLFGVLESLYLILKHRDTTSTDRYLLKAVEQEAYFHMHDSDYLTTRRSFAYFQFLRSKPVNLDWLKENDPEFFQ